MPLGRLTSERWQMSAMLLMYIVMMKITGFAVPSENQEAQRTPPCTGAIGSRYLVIIQLRHSWLP